MKRRTQRPAWSAYQAEVARTFRTLGLQARANARIKGVRTKHAIDVFVKGAFAGFEITWLVECKLWKSRVSKLHVLALREIVSDVGADRGILLAERGVQSGAVEAAVLTNVHISTLAQIRESTRSEVLAVQLGELFDRVERCKERYWGLSKEARIASGLRPEVGVLGYSGVVVIGTAEDLIRKGLRRSYPIKVEPEARTFVRTLPAKLESLSELLDAVRPLIKDLEVKLTRCETAT